VGIGTRQDQQELFATDTEYRVRAAQIFQQVLGHAFKNIIAFEVAMLVVKLFEMIQVDQRQRNRRALALCNGQLAGKKLIQITPVVKPGQRVTQRLLLQLLMQVGDGAQALLTEG